ncbi:Mannosyltransferase related to Gpi18 [Ruminococcaceae bacterium YRB3002]|nr:Mannosyltransferase related to Gpi18 [Ruminococcaceae bacterium YRB3002]
MKYFVGSVILFLILAFYAYRYFLAGIHDPLNRDVRSDRKFKGWQLILFFAAGLVLRIVISVVNTKRGYNGFPTDISCFTAWPKLAFDEGISNFYVSEMYTDYPPGFVYIFWIQGAFVRLFNLKDYSAAFVVLIKLPSILSDVGIAYLVYRMTRDMKISQTAGLAMALMILMNPLVLIDGCVWGQTDSVFVLLLAVVFYLFCRKKYIPGYFIYAVSILVKPQALVFAPVVLFAYAGVILDAVKRKKKLKETILIHTGSGLGAIALIFILMLPFGVSTALKQYTDTLASYPYGSVNAYNFWGLMGKIWIRQEEPFLGVPMFVWGHIAIGLIVGASILFFVKCRKSEAFYFHVAAFIITAVFTLSVRMHERYIFPAAIFLLFAFIMRPRLETYIAFVATSVVSFFNCYHVLYYYDADNFNRDNPVIKTICVMEILVFALVVFIMIRYFRRVNDYMNEKNTVTGMIAKNREFFTRIRESRAGILHAEDTRRMKKKDYIIVGIIILVYSCVAFYHLGDMDAPSTEYSLVKEGAVTLDFGEVKNIRELWAYLGHEFNQNYIVSYSDDYSTWYALYTEEDHWYAGSVYNWNKTDVDVNARYLYIAPCSTTGGDCIIELVFKDGNGNVITPVNHEDYHNLFDEQDYAVDEDTYLNGTYFDEVHYTRHVHEMKNGLYCYENTHPQLGKEIMAIGTYIFGMNPFGWRFSGTVCGIIMIFAMYVFALKFFGDTKLAALTTVVFSTDFMHFVQSRIATIDVYAVMFIMLSYIFMYEYTRMNFYETPLKRSYRPLLVCGIFMALGISSKWIGVYSAAGLAFILLVQFYYRYREFRLSLSKIEDDPQKGSDFDVVKSFNRKLVATVAWCLVVFVFIPLVLYTLTYIPFNDGHPERDLITKMIEAQKLMFNYHTNITSTHSYSSEWYQWPVMVRPVLYVIESVTDATRRDIVLMGNPVIWWAGIPASLYMIYLWFNERDRKAGFLMIGYLAQYLPWILVTRYTFIYHYFASVPFVTVMCVYALKKIGEKHPKLNKSVYIYAVVAVLLFLMYLPILNGTEVSIEYINDFLKWSGDWAM